MAFSMLYLIHLDMAKNVFQLFLKNLSEFKHSRQNEFEDEKIKIPEKVAYIDTIYLHLGSAEPSVGQRPLPPFG